LSDTGRVGREATGSFLVKPWNGQLREDVEFFLGTDQTNTCRNYKGITEVPWGRRRSK